jgi:hypothetical protein
LGDLEDVGTEYKRFNYTFQMTAAMKNGVELRIFGDKRSAGLNGDSPFTQTITGLMLHEGAGVIEFKTAAENWAEELVLCQRYYEKSYDLETAIGTITNVGARKIDRMNLTAAQSSPNMYVTRKRGPAVGTVYSPVTGTVNRVRDLSSSSDTVASVDNVFLGEMGFIVDFTSVNGAPYSWHFEADAEL